MSYRARYTIGLVVCVLAAGGWYAVGQYASGSAFLAGALVVFALGRK